ncbi:hypothetical protein [Pseudoduganella sp. OTU4001]|uniref:hypothetical protein n=1 Tax=Pseudoduganella sp. OTU4001 TaxID=3043854 RepID=UPI00313B60CB
MNVRDQRLQQLLDSCQQEVLRQIIGPFGLTPAMFNDKDGGNVATVHNAEQGVFPDELHEKNFELANENYSQQVRQKHWDDKGARGATHTQINKTLDAGGEVASAATGKPMTKGEIHGDHTVSLKEAHQNKAMHLRFTEEERKKMLNDPKNMAFIEASLNTSKGEKSWDECLADPEFVKKHGLTPQDIERIKAADKQARDYLQSEQHKRLAGELFSAGAKEAGTNALRQALGIVLHEFVNGSFVEVKLLLNEKHSASNLIDRLVESLKRVMARVIGKLKAALDAAIEGGIQGFVSNLLTFLINNLITTSKKIVTIIRESMRSLWKAIKLLLNPPKDMPALEVAREVSKVFATVITTGIGLLLEESVKGFIMSIPVLAPIADVLATALTAIMTGIAGALLIYGLDRLFDWLSSTGTELLAAQEANANAQVMVTERLQQWLQHQFDNSSQYEICAAEYGAMQESFLNISFQLETASLSAASCIDSHQAMLDCVGKQRTRLKAVTDELDALFG